MKIVVQNWRDIKNPEAGGAEIHIHEILKRLAKRGHDIIFISSKYARCKDEEILDGIRIIRIGNKYFFNFSFLLYYIRNLRRHDFDIIIDDISKIPLCIPFYIRKRPVVAVVHHIHGKTLFRELPVFTALYVYLMERLMIPLFYKNTPILAVSESTKKDLIGLGIPYVNIKVVYNGIDNKFTPGCKSNYPIILYFGRVKRYKRLDHIIMAFKHIISKFNGVRVVIAGKGDNYGELFKLSENLKVSDFIDFIGEVSESEKIKLLQSAWVFVTTSQKEGWGITVIEANACGTPVVAYDVEGLRDSVKHGYNGLLVEDGNISMLADTILKIIEDEDLRIKLSKNAVEWARRFSWDRSAEEFERLLKEVANEGYK